jgi:hypothetical protein
MASGQGLLRLLMPNPLSVNSSRVTLGLGLCFPIYTTSTHAPSQGFRETWNTGCIVSLTQVLAVLLPVW